MSLLKRRWIALLGLSLLISLPVQAKELQGRVGLGYSAAFGNSLPAISLKLGVYRDIALEGIFGFATGNPVNSVTGGKLFKNIFFEPHLNFYFMAGLAALTGSTSGVQAITGLGVEFFIPGIESLGFATEVGASYDNLSGSYVLRTLGLSFLNAGIHFYF